MDETLKKDIESIVSGIFSEKEESDMRKKTEDALQEAATTIEDLTTSLEEKNAESEELGSKISEHEEKIVNLETELEAAKKEIETSNKELEESESALKELKKDRAADIRMAELEDAKVTHSGEKEKSAQIVKVREMSDEEYASYKDELTSIRQAILDEIAATSETEAGEKEGDSEKVADKEDTTEEADTTDPAEIDKDKAVSAAFNLEASPSEDLFKKYTELGKAMAEKM